MPAPHPDPATALDPDEDLLYGLEEALDLTLNVFVHCLPRNEGALLRSLQALRDKRDGMWFIRSAGRSAAGHQRLIRVVQEKRHRDIGQLREQAALVYQRLSVREEGGTSPASLDLAADLWRRIYEHIVVRQAR